MPLPTESPHLRQTRPRRPLLVRLGLVFAVCLLLAAYALPVFALEVPQHQGYVTDLAGMLTPAARQRLEQMLLAFEETDSTQVAVLTIPSLEGDSLEEFSIRTVDAWKIGQKGRDNGVLLLVSKAERKIRIEVGRGLEGVLTDVLTGRIADNIITPRFKAGRFDEGFEAGVSALIAASRGEFKASGTRRGTSKNDTPPLFNYLIFFALLVGFLGRIGKTVGMLAGAVLLPLFVFMGLASPFGWLLLFLLIPGGALLGLLLPLFFAGSGRAGGPYLGSGGFGGGGFSSGGGFGGFGGGGFGGGGASGSW
ncbi:TPM domain-containing protein [Thiovibrio sp. JS02]